MSLIAQICSDRLVVPTVNSSRQNVGRGFQRRQGPLCCVCVVKHQSRDAIGRDNLGLDRQLSRDHLSKRNQIVGKKGSTSQYQRGTAHQHVHPRQLLGDGTAQDSEHFFHSPDYELFLTAFATFSNSELNVRLAFWAAVKLISKRTLLLSKTNWIMPPRCKNSGISLTVRTPALSMAISVSFRRFSSDELMNRMRQSTASNGLVIRLATTCLPSMVSPDKASSRIRPNGSWPSTQIRKESLLSDATLAGHSTNRPKLYRYAALTSYSAGFDC